MIPLSRSRRLALFLATALSLAPFVARVRADVSPEDLELQVKAAYLYKFAGYVEWPTSALASDRSPIVFGVMGDDPLAENLEDLIKHRGEDARPVVVLRLKPFEPMPDVQVLFIGRSESDHLGPLIRIAREKPVLVVTDTQGALALGSMINFETVEGRVRFEVGLASAQKCGLTMSSRLLAVAQTVEKSLP